MKDLYLSETGFQKLKAGDPWLRSRDLNRDVRLPKVPCLFPLGEHWFFLSPESDLRLRRLGPAQRFWPNDKISREPVVTNEDLQKNFGDAIREILQRSWKTKQQLLNNESCFRWIFSENDGIPGLTIDVFGDKAVAQINSAALENFWPSFEMWITAILQEQRGPKAQLLIRRDNQVRKDEGLEVLPFGGAVKLNLDWNGLKWQMEAGGAQKTGAYLDQRDNHRACANWAQKLQLKSAWDVCCFEGGFGLHLAKMGLNVKFIDQSEAALNTVKANLQLNGLDPSAHEFINDDAFVFLKNSAATQPDLIVLDPPSFAKSAKEKEGALRGFRDMNLRAMKAIAPNGLLVSCVCSHHITPGDYEKLLRQVSHDVRRDVRILEWRGPSVDHAAQINFPQGQYLQAWFLLIQ